MARRPWFAAAVRPGAARGFAAAVCLAATLVVALLAGPARAGGQADGAVSEAPIASVAPEPVRLGEGTWLLPSADPRSSAAVVFGGEEFSVLVDPGRTPTEAAARLARAQELTGAPVREVVLTSADPGAALGVLLLDDVEFEVRCQLEARRRLAEDGARLLREERAAASTPEEAAQFDARRFRLPERCVAGVDRLHLGGHRLRVLHVEGARDGAQLVVHSGRDGVVAAGALAFRGALPRISADHDLEGWVRGLESLGNARGARFVSAGGVVLDGEQLGQAAAYLRALLGGATERPECAASWSERPALGATFVANRRAAEERTRRTRIASGAGALGLVPQESAADSAAGDEADPPHSCRVAGLEAVVDPAARTLVVRDAESGARLHAFATGPDPLDPVLTRDGFLAFVPSAGGGRVHVYDLLGGAPLEDAFVGAGAGCGALTAGDAELVLPVAGKASVAWVDTATRELTHLLHDGLRPEPRGVVLTPNRRYGLVRYAESGVLTLFDVEERRVLAEEDLGHPIERASFTAAHRLRVEFDGADAATFTTPAAWSAVFRGSPARGEVSVLGTLGELHAGHADWDLDALADAVRRDEPQCVLVDLPPGAWSALWEDFLRRGTLERIRLPMDAALLERLVALRVELGFDVVPCGVGSEELERARERCLRELALDPAYAELHARLEALEPLGSLLERDAAALHSEAFDARAAARREAYCAVVDELLGLAAPSRLDALRLERVREALAARPGARVLVLWPAERKAELVRELRSRADVRWLEPTELLRAR